MADAGVRVYYGDLMMLPNVARVIACLHEKEVHFDLLDMNKGRLPLPPLFSKLQVSARVLGPAFDDGRKVLFESRAICRYVAEQHAEKGNRDLLGRDLLERSSIEQWLKSEENRFDPPSSALVFHLAFAPRLRLDSGEDDRMEMSEKRLSDLLDVYEQRLGESKYLAGNRFSLADLAHLPHSHYLANSTRWGHLFTSRKRLHRWWKAVSERESWQRTAGILNTLFPAASDEEKDLEPDASPVRNPPLLQSWGGAPPPPSPAVEESIHLPVKEEEESDPVEISPNSPISVPEKISGETFSGEEHPQLSGVLASTDEPDQSPSDEGTESVSLAVSAELDPADPPAPPPAVQPNPPSSPSE